MEAAPQPPKRTYILRSPETSILHEVVNSQLERFVLDSAKRGHPLPFFIQRTFGDYLSCGNPSAGFVRVRCQSCGHDRVLAFSCKRRGLCPSCGGRRMADTAADLVDFVMPHVGVRQWVLSLPFALRYRLAYDRSLLTPILGAFVRAVLSSHRRRIFERYGVRGAKCGAITFVQRFGGSLNLNVHFHTLVLEGGYEVPSAKEPSDQVRFLPLTAPSDDDVLNILADAAGRVARQLEKHRVRSGDDPDEADALQRRNPLLAELYAASVQGRVPSGPRAGQPTTRIGADATARRSEPHPSPLCAVGYGLSLHAGVYVPGTDRRRLERICRYTARPPLASERLRRLKDGRISYHMRHKWRDGTTDIVMEPGELMAKLAALIPPPRQHQVRYHGILAPCAAWRDQVVPGKDRCARAGSAKVAKPDQGETQKAGIGRGPRPWAQLMRRVFALDVLLCPKCGGRMRVLSQAGFQAEAYAILKSLGINDRAPPKRQLASVQDVTKHL